MPVNYILFCNFASFQNQNSKLKKFSGSSGLLQNVVQYIKYFKILFYLQYVHMYVQYISGWYVFCSFTVNRFFCTVSIFKRKTLVPNFFTFVHWHIKTRIFKDTHKAPFNIENDKCRFKRREDKINYNKTKLLSVIYNFA